MVGLASRIPGVFHFLSEKRHLTLTIIATPHSDRQICCDPTGSVAGIGTVKPNPTPAETML